MKIDKNLVFGQLGKIVFSVFIATFFTIFLMSFAAISQPSLSGILASFFIISPLISLNAVVIAMPLIIIVALPYNCYLLKNNKSNWLYWVVPPILITPIYSWFILSLISNSMAINDKFLGADNPLIYFIILGLLAGILCRNISFESSKKISWHMVGFFILGLIMILAIFSLFNQVIETRVLK